MSRIKLLPNNVINQIAAGEVIERPASVVKELLENAIDANSDQITLDITEGGLNQIRVLDNGVGMSLEEIKMAFIRHATSKIFSESDLSTISTLGFRGEALPSIASVSEVVIKSKQKDELQGHKMVFDNGNLKNTKIVACQKGTEIIVNNIFEKIPARKKFLGTSRGESQRITEVFQDLVFSNTDISFSYIRDDKLIVKTLGDGKLDNVISEILGNEYTRESLSVNFNMGEYKITGVISKPNFNQASRKKQYIYVNNRPINDGTITHALEYAFGNLIPKGRFPFAILFLDVPKNDVDVNVHPNKREIRFKDRRFIHSLVLKAVKNTLLSKDEIVRTTLHKKEEAKSQQSLRLNLTQNDKENYQEMQGHNSQLLKDKETSFAHKDYSTRNRESVVFENNQNDIKEDMREVPKPLQNISVLGQIHSSFIAIQNTNGLALIDQHAAHERIIYNRMKYSNVKWNIQMFAVPLKISFTKLVFNNILDYLEDIKNIGLDIEPFGTNSFILRGIPDFLIDYIDKRDIKETLEEIFKDKDKIKRWKQEILIGISCKAAIKIRQSLSNREIFKLIEDLAKTENWQYCPHGRPTVLEVSFNELEKMFKRT